ncbi:MAG: hypothetical protein U9N45_02885, partial [Gemmatimonadota bacterium]|nr:hypothetical protein [Gemmatimonadota bacterium]
NGEIVQTFTLAEGVGVVQGVEIDVTPEGGSAHSLTAFQQGGTIDASEYFPLEKGLKWTYEDGSVLECTGEKELDFYSEPLIERVWTTVPASDVADGDVREYYFVRGDSLFWVAHYFNGEGWDSPEFFYSAPPAFQGDGSTPLGELIPNEVAFVDVATGETNEEMKMELIITPAGTVSVPCGEYENCMRMITFIDGWPVNVMLLAPGVGQIKARYQQNIDYQGLTAFEGGAWEKTCDFTGDGSIGITDVIAFLLLGRADPSDVRLDWNGDGRYTITDAIALLLDIRNGTCPGQ